MTAQQTAITIAAVIFGTVLTRFLPYMVFSEGREIPETVKYLGRVLAPAVFGMLVIYCLRNVDFTGAMFGLPEIISLLVVIGLYVWKGGMLIPMAGGTACYMILIRLLPMIFQ
ncbi:MAG: AzlD domain-containing protein [Anaerovoracaceae bacterium]|nr:AzlD domain-containing protein [Bacillota bacterium]MDY2671247.1 AzlD domain-containing protein [Anaerovoracaceae bacterium]